MRLRLLVASPLVLTLALASPAAAEPTAAPSAVEEAEGFAAVDYTTMTEQFNRLRAAIAIHRDGSGGAYFDESTGQIVVRYVNNGDGASMRAKVGAQARRAGEVPVRFESTSVPMSRLVAATKILSDSRGWAGAHAAQVHQVWLDELTPQIVVEASGESGALVAAAQKATGLTPRVTVSASGPARQSRRWDSKPYYGGLAIWLGPTTAPATANAKCTTGFRMTRGGTNSNWVTTAGHCGPNGTWFWHPNGGYIARVSSNYDSLGTDVAMLAGENGAYFSRYSWFGGRDATTANPVSAKATAWPAIGSAVYVSGANGGLVYGKVTSTSGNCNGNHTVVINTQTGHTYDGYTQGGDSGAPVTRWNTSTSATDDLVAVGSHTCGNGAGSSWFTPIHLIEAATGAVVVVAGT